jgi:galactokinase
VKNLPESHYRVTAPGRVNLLGEHVDYNEGAVLPAAIDRAIYLTAQPRSDRLVNIISMDMGEEVTFSLDKLDLKIDAAGKNLPGWALYPAGVAWALQKHGFTVSGVEATFTSDIPIAAGLSSSAAIEVAFAVMWETMGGWSVERMKLAQMAQEAENRYVGVNCGLMDQFASAHGVKDHALYFDTRDLCWQPVPLPYGSVLIIADSGVRRSLVTSRYNERRASCEEAVRLLQSVLSGIRALRDVTPKDLDKYQSLLSEKILKRAWHVVNECARVDEAMRQLRAGNPVEFGKLMYAGHASLRDLYEVSCPELDALVDIASKLDGCWGARLTGAGFGGCTVNLVCERNVMDFMDDLKSGYKAVTGRDAEVYLCHASQGATAEETWESGWK